MPYCTILICSSSNGVIKKPVRSEIGNAAVDTSFPIDQAYSAVIDALVREFESNQVDSDPAGSDTSAHAYLAMAQERFVAQLREKLAEVESRNTDVSRASVDDMPATIDTAQSELLDDTEIQDLRAEPGHLETTGKVPRSPGRRVSIRSKKRVKSAKSAVDAPPDYEVLGRLGKGGMGVVYKARHLPLNRVVAIKMILGAEHASPDMLTRFRQEAEAAAHLTHPNIVSVYEVGEHHGLPYFSLEYR